MTRDEVLTEIDHLEKDLLAFKMARDDIHVRVRELGSSPERQEMFTDWPVFRVIDNGLIMGIVRCEGLIEDYRELLDTMDIPNVVKLERDNVT